MIPALVIAALAALWWDTIVSGLDPVNAPFRHDIIEGLHHGPVRLSLKQGELTVITDGSSLLVEGRYADQIIAPSEVPSVSDILTMTLPGGVTVQQEMTTIHALKTPGHPAVQ